MTDLARPVGLGVAARGSASDWSVLAAAGMPMGSLIVSHVAWDIWIFLVAPTAA